MFLVTLTPLKDGVSSEDNEELPLIQLHSHPPSYQSVSPNITDEVRLGRNGQTKLVDADLPRRLASVRVTEGGELKLSMYKGPNEHTAHLNGVKITSQYVSLQNGAILALLEGNRCQYRVSIIEDMRMGGTVDAISDSAVSSTTLSAAATICSLAKALEPASSVAAAAAANNNNNNNKTDDTRQRAMQQVCEELLCPVCMDILVDTVALNPCGHLFCSSCRQPPRSLCPTCRIPAFGAMPLKSVDGVILHMVKGGKCS
jgi:hypothetical protein